MARAVRVFALALLLASAPAARAEEPAGSAGTASPSEVVRLLAAIDEAVSARDVDRFLSYFDDGPDFAYTFNGRVHASVAETRAAHVAAWSKLKSFSAKTGTPRVVTLGPDAAVATATGRTVRVLETGEERTGDYVVTLALRRGPSGWRIVQAHESTLPRP